MKRTCMHFFRFFVNFVRSYTQYIYMMSQYTHDTFQKNIYLGCQIMHGLAEAEADASACKPRNAGRFPPGFSFHRWMYRWQKVAQGPCCGLAAQDFFSCYVIGFSLFMLCLLRQHRCYIAVASVISSSFALSFTVL
jgi:hypothetical protein